MLPNAELESLFPESESEAVECKESVKDVEKARQVICAFANDLAARRRPAIDGQAAVRACRDDFEALAKKILAEANLERGQ